MIIEPHLTENPDEHVDSDMLVVSKQVQQFIFYFLHFLHSLIEFYWVIWQYVILDTASFCQTQWSCNTFSRYPGLINCRLSHLPCYIHHLVDCCSSKSGSSVPSKLFLLYGGWTFLHITTRGASQTCYPEENKQKTLKQPYD